MSTSMRDNLCLAECNRFFPLADGIGGWFSNGRLYRSISSLFRLTKLGREIGLRICWFRKGGLYSIRYCAARYKMREIKSFSIGAQIWLSFGAALSGGRLFYSFTGAHAAHLHSALVGDDNANGPRNRGPQPWDQARIERPPATLALEFTHDSPHGHR